MDGMKRPKGRFEWDIEGHVIEIEYDSDGPEVFPTAVWSGKWNVLDKLDGKDYVRVQEAAHNYAWNL